ncbi:unnamed protein product [Timema podura]|uniref:Uncharacterized protein n=1 Tax=Timema podura TaxID=61482 RepID=A0ABN7P8Y5_TIMPD|nr:unnamed protein product [Timema podura]
MTLTLSLLAGSRVVLRKQL